MAKVSVIVPVYNTARYVARCVQGVIDQTFTDWELILVNDGSPDNAQEVLTPYLKDSRICLINQRNQGLSVARNVGLKKASGRYVYFVDSDDVVHSRLLETVFSAAERNEADIVLIKEIQLSEAELPDEMQKALPPVLKERPIEHPMQYLLSSQTTANQVEVCFKLWRRTIFDKVRFAPHLKYEDIHFTPRAFNVAKRAVALDAKLYFYLTYPDSISHRPFQPRDLLHFTWTIDDLARVFASRPEFCRLRSVLFAPVLTFLWSRVAKESPGWFNQSRLMLYYMIAYGIKMRYFPFHVFPLRWRLRLFLASVVNRVTKPYVEGVILQSLVADPTCPRFLLSEMDRLR